MVTGREVGESTMIRVSYDVKEMIEKAKIIPREPLNDCIQRVFIAYTKGKEINEAGSNAIDDLIVNLPYIPEKNPEKE